MKIKICAVNDLADNASVKFIVPGEKFDRDAFLIKHDNSFYAYYNECPHIGIALDWDDNDFFTLDLKKLVCKNHGAEFLPNDGLCTAGPCTGAGLKRIEVVVENNWVYVSL